MGETNSTNGQARPNLKVMDHVLNLELDKRMILSRMLKNIRCVGSKLTAVKWDRIQSSSISNTVINLGSKTGRDVSWHGKRPPGSHALLSFKYNLWQNVMTNVRGQFIKKPNFFNLLLNLQLNQTCLLQSTPLHSWYTAPKVFSSSGTRPGTCFAGWCESPVSYFLLPALPSEIGDLLVRISTSGTRKSPRGPNLESRVAGGQQSSHVSSKIHG